jgi:hypothetical protein
MKIKRIPYVIYDFDLIIFTGGTEKEISKYLKSIVPDDVEDEVDEIDFKSRGYTFMFSSGQTIIRFGKDSNMGTVAHEIFHAAEFLMRRLRMTLSDDSSEAYAYLIGYITNQYYQK